jgi:hypothetical protein
MTKTHYQSISILLSLISQATAQNCCFTLQSFSPSIETGGLPALETRTGELRLGGTYPSAQLCLDVLTSRLTDGLKNVCTFYPTPEKQLRCVPNFQPPNTGGQQQSDVSFGLVSTIYTKGVDGQPLLEFRFADQNGQGQKPETVLWACRLKGSVMEKEGSWGLYAQKLSGESVCGEVELYVRPGMVSDNCLNGLRVSFLSFFLPRRGNKSPTIREFSAKECTKQGGGGSASSKGEQDWEKWKEKRIDPHIIMHLLARYLSGLSEDETELLVQDILESMEIRRDDELLIQELALKALMGEENDTEEENADGDLWDVRKEDLHQAGRGHNWQRVAVFSAIHI